MYYNYFYNALYIKALSKMCPLPLSEELTINQYTDSQNTVTLGNTLEYCSIVNE